MAAPDAYGSFQAGDGIHPAAVTYPGSFDSLCWAQDWTHTSTVDRAAAVRFLTHCTTAAISSGIPSFHLLWRLCLGPLSSLRCQLESKEEADDTHKSDNLKSMNKLFPKVERKCRRCTGRVEGAAWPELRLWVKGCSLPTVSQSKKMGERIPQPHSSFPAPARAARAEPTWKPLLQPSPWSSGPPGWRRRRSRGAAGRSLPLLPFLGVRGKWRGGCRLSFSYLLAFARIPTFLAPAV